MTSILRSLLAASLVVLALTGCTETITQNTPQTFDNAGRMSANTVDLMNDLSNLELQQRLLNAYSQNTHRGALDTYGGQARDTMAGNATEAALRGYQGSLNALQAGSDVREAGRTTSEVLKAQSQALSDLGATLGDLRREVSELKAASGN